MQKTKQNSKNKTAIAAIAAIAAITTMNKHWLTNPDQKKTPKIFSFQAIRHADGSFQLIDGSTHYERRVNQFKAEWVPVNTGDMADVMQGAKIYYN